MYFQHQTLHGFTQEHFAEIRPHTYKDGYAREVFAHAAKGILFAPEKYQFLKMFHDHKFLMAWSIVAPNNTCCDEIKKRSPVYMCFVRPLFRKMGYGRKLFQESVKRARLDGESVAVCGWDERSDNFYSKMISEGQNVNVVSYR